MKKNKVGRFTLPDLETCYEAEVIKTISHYFKISISVNRIELTVQQETLTFSQGVWSWVSRLLNRERKVFTKKKKSPEL